jgi:hypothetical protein
MASEQQKDETLEKYRERLNREFDEKFPELAKFEFPWPWDESMDRWFEAVTGETIPEHERAPRNPDL